MIETKDISVVIQGPVIYNQNITQRSCSSVRRFMPDAEIILSTWEHEVVDGIDFDIVIYNKDPGTIDVVYKETGYLEKSNINRQIVSSYNGILRASRKYVMKMRTDTVIRSWGGVEKILCKVSSEIEEKVACFEPRMPIYINQGIFSLCDFWFLGLKEKMLLLWGCPLCKAKEKDKSEMYNLIPEEYIFYEYCKRNGVESVDNKKYFSFLCNHFIIIPCHSSNIVSQKYPKWNSFWDVYFKHNKVSEKDYLFYKRKRPINIVVHSFSMFSGACWNLLRCLRNDIRLYLGE